VNAPSEAGFYWREGLDEDDNIVRQIVEVGPLIRTRPDELFYWVPGDIGARYVQSDPEYNTKWFGPIHEPEALAQLFTELTQSFRLLQEHGIDCDSLVDGIRVLINKTTLKEV
jgi:hypothetical protein